MKKRLLTWLLFASGLQPALAEVEPPPVPPPWELDDPLLPHIAEIAAGAARSGSTGNGTFLGQVAIQPAQLTAATKGLQVVIAGDRYELHLLDQKDDPHYKFRHVTLQVRNHERSYARFSVDERNRLVYGAIYTPERIFRITPSRENSNQDVYLTSRDRADPRPEVRLLGWRHNELESVAVIRPDQANVRYETRVTYVNGGRLGLMLGADARNFVRTATRLSSMTQFQGTETFRIVESTSNEGGRVIRLQQLIDGIPVEANNEVFIDPSGKVLRLATALVASDFVPMQPVLSQAEAWSRVGVEAETSSLKATLLYRPVGSMNTLELVYEFWFTATPPAEYFARVNAIDGRAEVTRLESH